MDFVVLDTETTGKNDGIKLDEPVSIGIIDSDGKVLLDTLVKPSVEIDAEATAVHGITAEMVKDAPDPYEVLCKVAEITRDRIIVGYNIGFDYRVMLNAAYKECFHLPFRTLHDVMPQYAALWNAPDEKYQKLAAAIEQQGLPFEVAHNAVADCKMTLSLYNHIIAAQGSIIGLKCYAAGERYQVSIVAIEKKKVATGKNVGAPYLRLHTRGSQQINVFDPLASSLGHAGYPVFAWMKQLDFDTVQPISTPIDINMTYGKSGYPELVSILSQHQIPAE